MEVMLDVSAVRKKYPLYRLAINPLKLLERQHYEMHPSCSSFAEKKDRHFVRRTQLCVIDEVEFLIYFIEKSDFLYLRARNAGFIEAMGRIIFLKP